MMGMPSCREVTEAVASGRLEGAPVRRRLALWMHLLVCSPCRRYERQIRALGRAARDLFGEQPAEDEVLERLRQHLRDRIEPRDGA